MAPEKSMKRTSDMMIAGVRKAAGVVACDGGMFLFSKADWASVDRSVRGCFDDTGCARTVERIEVKDGLPEAVRKKKATEVRRITRGF